MSGVKPRFAVEPYDAIPGAEVLSNNRPLELAMALINRADRLVLRAIRKGARHQIGDKVLLRLGWQPERSKFAAQIWLGPFNVISVEHPSYGLENAPGRKSKKPAHFRRLHPYLEKYEAKTDGEAKCCLPGPEPTACITAC